MGWMASDDQPPVLNSEQGTTAYPPPSAAATPTALGEANSAPTQDKGLASRYPATRYPAPGQLTSAPSTAPAAAAVPTSGTLARNATPAAPVSKNPAGTASAPTTGSNTPVVGGSFAPNSSAVASTTAEPNGLPIGLPPGVTAPQIPRPSAATTNQYAGDVQQGTYPLSENPASAAPQSVAAAPPINYPLPGSGSATTWDSPSPDSGSTSAGSPTPSGAPAANVTAGNFEPSPGASDFPAAAGGGVEPIGTVAATPTEAVASYDATASHYESLAAEHASNTQVGPWRPGSTTNYEAAAVAAAPPDAGLGPTGQPPATAALPNHRNSGFE